VSGPWTAGQVVIAAGQPYSTIIDTNGYHFLGLRMPAAMDGTSFTVYAFGAPGASADDSKALADATAALGAGPGTFQEVFDATGAAVGPIVFAAGTCVGIDSKIMAALAGFRFLVLKSSVNETAQRVIGYSLKA